eukprot:6869102-Alexandrium_andersonii.AAC.1
MGVHTDGSTVVPLCLMQIFPGPRLVRASAVGPNAKSNANAQTACNCNLSPWGRTRKPSRVRPDQNTVLDTCMSTCPRFCSRLECEVQHQCANCLQL